MSTLPKAVHQPWPGLIAAYRDRLPVEEGWTAITLLEGGTPLVPAPRLSNTPGRGVHLKVEALNPTGSFKDRGMTWPSRGGGPWVSRRRSALDGQHDGVGGGFRGAAGIKCAVLVPAGQDRDGQACAGRHARREDHPDRRQLRRLAGLARKLPTDFPTISLVNSVNPYRIEGQKTARSRSSTRSATHRTCSALPVGNAGNITAYWKGYTEYHRDGLSDRLPACSALRPLARPHWWWVSPVSHPETIATAIRIGSPASWTRRSRRQQQSKGVSWQLPMRRSCAAYHLVARSEGVFVEPASAASIAGLLKSVEDGWVA